MAHGLFITGFTVAEVLAIQRRAKELLLEGKTVMNWNDADTVFVVHEGSAMIELDGTTACRINLVAGEYS